MTDKQYGTKSSMVYHRVREDIRHGIFPPGERLFISNIANKYEISEIPVREAFRALAQEGLLTSKPNTGFFVSKISKKDVENIFQVRLSLEILATREASRRITEEGVEKLHRMIDESRQNISGTDYVNYWKFNRTWHFTLYEFCKNDQLLRMLSELYNASSRYPVYYTNIHEVEDSIRKHMAIVDALRIRDGELAEALIKIHTIESYYHYLKRLHDVLGENFEE